MNERWLIIAMCLVLVGVFLHFEYKIPLSLGISGLGFLGVIIATIKSPDSYAS